MRCRVIASSLLLMTVVSGCGNPNADNCASVAGHIISMLREELAKGPADELKRARANLPTLQNSLMETCETSSWSQSTRKCILNANSVSATVECKPTNIPIPSE